MLGPDNGNADAAERCGECSPEGPRSIVQVEEIDVLPPDEIDDLPDDGEIAPMAFVQQEHRGAGTFECSYEIVATGDSADEELIAFLVTREELCFDETFGSAPKKGIYDVENTAPQRSSFRRVYRECKIDIISADQFQ